MLLCTSRLCKIRVALTILYYQSRDIAEVFWLTHVSGALVTTSSWSGKDTEERGKMSLQIVVKSASNLPNLERFSKSDPMTVVVFQGHFCSNYSASCTITYNNYI